MKVTVLTLGCKTNLSESDSFKSVLSSAGHRLVPLDESPDVCIINTCTVTSKTDYQCRQLIRRALKKGARVIVTGCYAMVSEEKIRAISKDNIEIIKEKDKILQMFRPSSGVRLSSMYRARPFVKIQEGCNHNCSYCIIPRARGRSKSRPVREVLQEVLALEAEGYPEIVLTGIHLGHYGLDLGLKEALEDLLESILENTKNVRVRLSSLEAHEVSDRLLELMQHSRLCPHLHIPLQSGDDYILKRMKRPYNVKTYINRVNTFLKKIPNLSLGTDVIVGFPGEGEKEFLNTKKVLEDTGFSYLHVFPYSKRPGTAAAEFSDQVNERIKKQRVAELKMIDRQKRTAYRQAQINRLLEVVPEKLLSNGLHVGKSENYLKVYFNSSVSVDSRLVKVRIVGLHEDGVLGISL